MNLKERQRWDKEIGLCIKHQYQKLYRENYNNNPLEFGMRIHLFTGIILREIGEIK